jgi:cytochrome P450
MSNTALMAPRPAHVPDSAVFDFDMFLDPALLKDPHERVRQLLRDAPPVFWTPHNRGHWITLRFEDIHRAMREPKSFSSAMTPPEQQQAMMARMPPGTPRIPLVTPILLDPPAHTKYRAPLQKAFSPNTVMALKVEIEALSNQLVDAVIADGSCDLIPAVAEQLPVRVFLKMMGLPIERLAEFRMLVREFLKPADPDPMDQPRRMLSIANAMKSEILARRDDPRDDLISALWKIEVDGQPMTFDLMEDYACLLFIAGLDTVINGIGFGIRHLASNPELQAELRENPKLIPEAAEEILRRYSFVAPQRRIIRDTELGGQTLKAGDALALYLPAAGLDPETFPAPEQFDLRRENKAHVAFGAGPHRCIGLHLARIELQSLYAVILEKLPTFRLDPEKPARFHAGYILAMASLPIRWD